MNLQNDGEVNIVTPNQTNNIGISTTVPSIPTVTASFRYNPIDGCVTIFSNISGKVNNIFKKGSSYGTSSNSNSSSGSSSGSSTIRRKERILSLLLPVDISTNMTNQTACEDNSMQSTPRVATTVIIDNIAPISCYVITSHTYLIVHSQIPPLLFRHDTRNLPYYTIRSVIIIVIFTTF